MLKDGKREVKLGLEKVLEKGVDLLNGLKVGLICNQASVDHNFRHSADLFFESDSFHLTTLFGPQHGIRGDVQDNMVETSHGIDKQTGLPIYSLYSETREPTEEMLANVDALCFDLQDVGCRVYTFIYTMANALKACAKFGKKMIVLDRPNPIGGIAIEGNVLEIGHESFVGQYPIPMRHGMTVGELALMFNRHFGINAELEIVKMDGWERQFYYDETDCPWVMPSPNMPTTDTAVVFPATVYFEGTMISEGRGTTRPFELVGAPYIDAFSFAKSLNSLKLDGIYFRPVNFLPTFQKHHNIVCGGVFLHITDRNYFQPVLTGIEMTKCAFQMYPKEFKWKDTPYEYVFDRNPFDVISGSFVTRLQIESNVGANSIIDSWNDDLIEFRKVRENYLLY